MRERHAFSFPAVPRSIGRSRTTDWLPTGVASGIVARTRGLLAGIALLALLTWQAVAFAADPYVADPAFPWQGFNANAFGVPLTGPNQSNAGRKVAKLADGKLVVASLVKKLDGSQANGLWNLGLTRYDPETGLALPWSNRDAAYSGIKPWDIVYPNTAAAGYNWIQSVKVLDGHILVAVNRQFSGSDVDVYVLVFGEDGSFQSSTGIFTTSAAEHVGGMDAYQTLTSVGVQIIRTNTVVVAATKLGSPSRPLFRRLELNANGSLTDKTGVVALNTHYCADTTRDCEPAGVALGVQLLQSTSPYIYVLNRVFESGIGYFTVTRVNANGTADASWSGQRIYGIGDASLWAEAIAVRPGFQNDEIFVASERKLSCRNGIEVDRLDQHGENTSWASVGGSDSSNPTFCLLLSRSYPNALAIDGDRLALAGFDATSPLLLGEENVDAALSILDIRGDALKLQNKQVFSYADDERLAHSGAWDVLPTGRGRFVLAGDGRHFASEIDGSAGKTFSFLLGVRPDRLFGDGFDP